MTKPIVAIVGRPNVGKSTLFNRIIGERRAVVSDIPGTTRDRIIANAEWNERAFTLVDTGGIEVLPPTVMAGRRPGPRQVLSEDSAQFIPLIRAQAEQAIAEADVILFLVDAQTGITGADREVADLLRRTPKPVLVVANKVEGETRRQQALEFYELGFEHVYPVSALQGGVELADLMDALVEALPPATPEEKKETPGDEIAIAILGRPNVGKSSLLNRLLGQPRAIVSDIPGTTRDALDTPLEWEGQRLVLIDTAGIRRRGHIEPGVEKFSVLRAARALERADVALLVLDAVEGITDQDAHIAGLIMESGISAVVLVNKWDAVPPEVRRDQPAFEEKVRYELKFMPYVPILFISALTGKNTERVLPAAIEVVEARYQRLSTGQLNDLVHRVTADVPPPNVHGRQFKIYYVTQVAVAPPTFVFFVNDPRLMHFSYERFLENRIRELYPFPGTPIRLLFRGHEKKGEAPKRKKR